MGLPVNDKNKNKKGNQKNNSASGNSKFMPKANTKGSSGTRPHKTGGTRGS